MTEAVGRIVEGISMEDGVIRRPWRYDAEQLEEAERAYQETRPRMTIQSTTELNRAEAEGLWPTIARLFGLVEKEARSGDPLMVEGAEVRVEHLRADIVQVTVPVTVILFGEDAAAFLAAVEEAAGRA